MKKRIIASLLATPSSEAIHVEDERKIKGIPENPASYGFACIGCASPLLLSDSEVSSEIMACFKLGGTSSVITCPKCGVTSTYTCDDLRMFASDGPVNLRGKKAQASSSE